MFEKFDQEEIQIFTQYMKNKKLQKKATKNAIDSSENS